MPANSYGGPGFARVARIGIFSALAFGVNAPFLVIPNIETFSLALFLSGLFLGFLDGVLVGFVAGIIFIFFNPNGPQTVIPVGLAQLLGFMLFGLAGGALRRLILKNYKPLRASAIMLAAGAILTLWYDLSTNLVFALIFGPFWPTLIGGLSFGIIHLISNTVIFALAATMVHTIWKRIEHLLPPLAG